MNSWTFGGFAGAFGQQAVRARDLTLAQMADELYQGYLSSDLQQVNVPFYQLGLGLAIGNQLGMSHLGTVKEFRKKFKEYSKAEFREMGKSPVIKEILSGMTKLNKEQIKERIEEHLAVAV